MSNLDPVARGIPFMPSSLFMEHIPVYQVPGWILPTAFRILHGSEPPGAPEGTNGIGVNEEGDLVLYRKIPPDDTLQHLGLIGVDEVWIVIALPGD